MLIGILQCGHFPTASGHPKKTYTDLYSGFLAGHGLTFETYSVVDMEFPNTIRSAEGWLVTGSKHGAYEDHDFIPPLENLIRDAYANAVPMVGICFGHQIIAQALGGVVRKYDGGWSIGRTEYDFGGETLAMNAWHQDQVVTVPPDAQVTASTPFCANAGLVYKGRAMSIQPHPEFGTAEVDLLLETRAQGVVPTELIKAATAEQGKPLSNQDMASRIAAFFKEST